MIARLRAGFRDAWRYVAEQRSRMAIVGCALVVGFSVGAPVGDAGFDYTWRNANFCGDCHVHQYANEAFFRSVHGGVTTCHDCHKVPLSHYPVELWIMLTDRPEEMEDFGPVHVPSVLCGGCHLRDSTEHLTGPMTDAFKRQVVKVDDSPLHRVHLQAETREPSPYLGAGFHAPKPPDGKKVPYALKHEGQVISCLDCHGSGGDHETHRFTASRDNCVRCHAAIDVAGGRLAGLRCQECHLTGFVGQRELDAR